MLREYIWLGWEPIAVVQGGAVQAGTADHIYRPTFATNAAGAVVWAQSYDPFGRVVAGAGADTRFAGQWFSSENGLHQNWMRDHDATLGRYIQASGGCYAPCKSFKSVCRMSCREEFASSKHLGELDV